MKNIVLISVLSLMLCGCGGLSGSLSGRSVTYTGKNVTTTVSKAKDSTPENTHIVGTFVPNVGSKSFPKVTGSLTDMTNGGKQLDLWVKTGVQPVALPVK